MTHFLLLLAISTQSAHIATSNICDKAITTLEINECGRLNYEQADMELNKAYRKAIERAEESDDDPTQAKDVRKSLIEAQRLWIQFRDKDCDATYNLWRGGTIRGAMYWGCMLDHTETRTKQLESFAHLD